MPVMDFQPDSRSCTLCIQQVVQAALPHQQSRIMAAKLKEAGVPSELIVMKGGGHDEVTVREHIPQALAWFDKYLVKKGNFPASK